MITGKECCVQGEMEQCQYIEELLFFNVYWCCRPGSKTGFSFRTHASDLLLAGIGKNHTTKHDLSFFSLIETKNVISRNRFIFRCALEIEFWPPLLKQRTWYFAFVG